MNGLCRPLFGLLLATALVGCANAHRDSVLMPGSGTGSNAESRQTSSLPAPSTQTRQFPLLPNAAPNNARPVPGGLEVHGPYRYADVKYPSNLGATNLLSQQQILQKAHLAPGHTNTVTAPLTVESVKVKRFGDVDQVVRGFRLFTTSSDRQVYEITTSFIGPYENRGTTFGSGKRVFIVDAATGDVLLGTIYAPMLQSSFLEHRRNKNTPPPGALLPPSQAAPLTGATAAPPH